MHISSSSLNRAAFSIRTYHSPPLPAGLPNYILYPHRAVVSKFLLVGQHWHVHVKESLSEHPL